MATNSLEFIQTSDVRYPKAVAIRIKCFFENYPNAESLIQDEWEETGLHLIVSGNNQVKGTGRLNIAGKTGIISQMAINPSHQNQGIGSLILETLTQKCQELNLQNIELSARVTALNFYHKHGFTAIGKEYPSMKTGIIHQEMKLLL